MSSIGDGIKLKMQELADALDASVRDPLTDQIRAPIRDDEVEGVIQRFGFGTPGPPKQTYPAGYPVAFPGAGFGFGTKQAGTAYKTDTFLDILLRAMNFVLGENAASWTYLPLTQPTGMVTAAEALWQFDASGSQLDDRTPNGHNLSLALGNQFNTRIGSFAGLGFTETERYDAPSSAALQITGAITYEIMMMRGLASSSDDIVMIHVGAVPGVEVDNVLYTFMYLSGAGTPTYFSEHDVSVQDILNFNGYVPVGNISLYTVTRSAGGSVNLYENGVLLDSGAVTVPTGGTAGNLMFGRAPDGLQRFTGVIFSTKITPAEFTAAQVLESYERARGLII